MRNISPQNVEFVCRWWRLFSEQRRWEETKIMLTAARADGHYRFFTLLVSIWSLLELNVFSILQALVCLWVFMHDEMWLAVHCGIVWKPVEVFTEPQNICNQIETFWGKKKHMDKGSNQTSKEEKNKLKTTTLVNPASLHSLPIMLRLQSGSQRCWGQSQLRQGQGGAAWKIIMIKKQHSNNAQIENVPKKKLCKWNGHLIWRRKQKRSK